MSGMCQSGSLVLLKAALHSERADRVWKPLHPFEAQASVLTGAGLGSQVSSLLVFSLRCCLSLSRAGAGVRGRWPKEGIASSLGSRKLRPCSARTAILGQTMAPL